MSVISAKSPRWRRAEAYLAGASIQTIAASEGVSYAAVRNSIKGLCHLRRVDGPISEVDGGQFAYRGPHDWYGWLPLTETNLRVGMRIHRGESVPVVDVDRMLEAVKPPWEVHSVTRSGDGVWTLRLIDPTQKDGRGFYRDRKYSGGSIEDAVAGAIRIVGASPPGRVITPDDFALVWVELGKVIARVLFGA